ncbi:MAG TPA: Ig-like domain-containing protein [Gemmatimonadota bacterium]|nr:Ig-like domain-containing protein [Gemmatimonadota bacterium]
MPELRAHGRRCDLAAPLALHAALGPAALLGFAAACASEGFPPGGPEDLTPPVLVESSPADRAVNATPDQAIRLTFDEVIDDQQLGQLPRLILVNPDVPDFDIELDEDTVTLAPQAPMAPGVTYSVTILPGLRDRAGNATVEPRTIFFSVGGEEPITLSIVRGTILRDSVPAIGALYRLENTDAGYGYTAVADSEGQVELEAVEYGPYVATAWLETVSPQGWQMTEEPGAQDTFELSLDQRSHEATYRIAVVDTTAPVVVSVATPSSRLIEVTLDDPLPADDLLTPAQVELYAGAAGLPADISPDSLPLESVRTQRLSIERIERSGPTAFQVVPEQPLVRGGVYRIDPIGIVNASGLRAGPEAGRTFRAEYEGPRVFQSEPIPWPAGAP